MQLELPATLWSVPDGPWPAPPVQPKPALLPVGELTPENAERLFTRMLETEAHIEHATLYGLPGQAQAGIDVYARTTPSLDASSTPGRSFVALQSRRVQSLTAASITSAVTDFLAGEWADRCSRFTTPRVHHSATPGWMQPSAPRTTRSQPRASTSFRWERKRSLLGCVITLDL